MDKDYTALKKILGHEPSPFEMVGYKLWLRGTQSDKQDNSVDDTEENKYNPSQPRDDYGRWVGMGGSGKVGFSKAGGTAQYDKAFAEAQAMVEAMKPDNEYLGRKIGPLGADLGIQAVRGPIKGPKRMAEKAVEELGGNVHDMKDVVRGTLVVQSHADIPKTIERIKQDFEIVRVKELKAVGYQDTKVNIKMPSSGYAGELILITPELLHAKMRPTLFKETGHDLYDVIRDPKSSPADIETATTKSEKIYGAATAKYEARIKEGKKLTLDYLVSR